MLKFRGSSDIKRAVAEHLAARSDLAGRVVVDVPAGTGWLAQELARRGARVEAYDLFPEACRAEGVECRSADLRQRLPVPDGHADLVLFAEAVEHLPDPLHALEELGRILRPGGILLVTTPNVSHLRARASHLLLESELYSRLPPNELDGLWYASGGRSYLGHLFLIGAQRLCTVAGLAGFRLRRVLPVKVSRGSLLLAWLYPVLGLAHAYAAWRTRRRLQDADDPRLREMLRERVRLGLHPTVLFGKHLFLELEKIPDPSPTTSRKHADTIR